MKSATRFLGSVCLALSLFVFQATAQVVQIESTTSIGTFDASTTGGNTPAIDLTSTSDSIILVVLSYESNDSINTVSLDLQSSSDVSLTNVGGSFTGATSLDIWAAQLPAPEAGARQFVVVSSNSMSNIGFAAFQLSNAVWDPTPSVESAASPNFGSLSGTFSGVPNGSLIIDSINLFSTSDTLSTTGITRSLTSTASTGSNYTGVSYTENIQGNTGPTVGWSNSSTTTRGAFAAILITPVPEPTVLALLGLAAIFGMGLAVRIKNSRPV